jgi:hypothetical protein
MLPRALSRDPRFPEMKDKDLSSLTLKSFLLSIARCTAP